MTKYTKSQFSAIKDKGNNILVSAGAGSGKTTVLTERVLRYIQSGNDIKTLLIMTFTKLAAKQMKEKIKQKLKKINDPKLIDQIRDVDNAYIGTLDSFTLSIVTRYSDFLNLDSQVSIIDNEIVQFEIKRIVDEIFNEEYQKKEPLFLELVKNTCVKNDDMLQKRVINLYNQFSSLASRYEYLETIKKESYTDETINGLKEEYLTFINKQLTEVLMEVNELNNIFPDRIKPEFNFKIVSDTINNKIKYLKEVKFGRRSKNEEKDIFPKEKVVKNIKDILELGYCNKKDKVFTDFLETKNTFNILIYLIETIDKRITEFKKKNNKYTFNDINLLTIKLLEEHPEVREEIRNSFNEILVDEYQDTSDIQDKLLSLIGNNNLYMVGDIKQSIYRFRHANPEIFKFKYQEYGKSDNECIKIDLLENFRSREEVINGINDIFSDLMTDEIGGANYKNEHLMKFGNKRYSNFISSTNDYDIEVLNYKDEYDNIKDNFYNVNQLEATIIGKDIKRKMENHFKVLDNDGLREAEYQDFCILIDRTTGFKDYEDVFRRMGIPYNVHQSQKFLFRTVFSTIRDILSFIIGIHKKDKTFLKMDYLSIARSFLFETLDNDCFDAIINNDIDKTDVYLLFEPIASRINTSTINDILEQILDVTDIYKKISLLGDVKYIKSEAEGLLEKANSFDELGYSISDYLDYLDLIVNEKIKGEYEYETVFDKGVNIINIHKSKGLEFSICYYPGLSSKFPQSNIGTDFIFDKELGLICPHYKYSYSDTFLKEWYAYKNKMAEISEKIRLLYVGITRAKEKIIFVANYDEDKIVHPLKARSNLDLLSNYFNRTSRMIAVTDFEKENIRAKKRSLYFEGNRIYIKPYVNNSSIINKKHFSKGSDDIVSREVAKEMEFGTLIHYVFEVIDYKNHPLEKLDKIKSILNLDNKIYEGIKYFLESELLKDIVSADIFKEYIFYEDGSQGIIDLMIRREDHIDIIDYKLSDIEKDAYKTQLKGYKEYITSSTKMKTNVYLYSVLEKRFKKI